MSSQLTCGSKRVAKMLASRLRFTERRPLPWPFPVTHVFFLGRAPVDFTRDGCVVFCRRRTTVVHSIVVGAQTDVDDAQTDVDGAQTDVDGAQTDVDGAKTDVDGAQADVNGAQTDIDGAQIILAVSTAATRRSTALTISVRSTVASRCMPTLALRTSISS